MLRRLDSIKGCGIFGDYRWDSALPDLARINVVYGNNGSGKTSLARALDSLRHEVTGALGFAGVSLTVEDGAGRRTTGGQDDPSFNRVLVFSEDYVERNHRFKSGSPDMAAVLTLGQRTAEAEVRLEVAHTLLDDKTRELDAAKKTIAPAKSRLDAVYDRLSKTVVSDNKRAGGKYQSHGTYNVGSVKAAFCEKHDDWALLGDDDLAAKKQLIASDNREPLTVETFGVAVDAGLAAKAAAALVKTPVTIVLDTLQARPEASAWVQEGQEYHAELDQCIYCGQPLSTARKHDIEQHFSDEVAALQGDLQSLIDDLQAVETDVDDVLACVPARALLFDDLRPRYDAAVEVIRSQGAELTKWSRDVRQRIEHKRDNVLAAADADVTDPPGVDGVALGAVRDEHNERVANHATLVQEAARAVELHHLKSAEKEIADLVAACEGAKNAVADAALEIAELGTEVKALESVEGDPTPSAQVLTQAISQLLGRSELKFEAVDERYVVTRDAQPAAGLSVGERTVIALVHFLESAARFDDSGGKPIVVIDDPVSSLDNDTFMGISTYIWAETVAKDHVAQVILLTHNFDLFRQWDVQIEGLHRGKGMAPLFPASFYEIRSRHTTDATGNTRRRPYISAWPTTVDARRKLRSSYHHAFMALARAKKALAADDSLDNRLDAQLLFPNVIRRLLETFLAFKRPEWVGDFSGAMRNSAALLKDSGYAEGTADALRLRLTRYAHAGSHADTPATDSTVNPDEVATAITDAFAFMKCVDEPHFRGLCEVLDLKPQELLKGSADPVAADRGQPGGGTESRP